MASREIKFMQTKSQSTSHRKNYLLLSLFVLTVFLVLAEISFLIQCSGMYLGDFKLIANHLSIPLKIIPGVVYFVSVQLFIHISFAILVGLITLLISIALHLSEKNKVIVGIGLWFVALFAILVLNRIYFPNSKFSSVMFNSVHIETAKILLAILSLILLSAALLASFGLGMLVIRQVKNKFVLWVTAFISIFLVFVCSKVFSHSKEIDGATTEKPNVIIIGIDSVRPDFLGFFGYAKKTPHIDGFLNHATVFSDSLTPLARTYPSWVSILTGIYPKLNSIRTNLADQSRLDVSETLPAILREEGYQTFFATDETRFSNIDQRYGFDKVITPPIGFNDFLVGTINDFPMSNLLINTAVGRYLFPYSYGNRAVFATYDPNSFLKLLQPTLSTPRTKPALFIVHFCLPHFPYAWSALPVKRVTLHHYQSALIRADKQFHDFMVMLQQNKWLEHSVVVLLSDHGETVEIPGDRITDPDLFVPSKQQKKGIIPHFYPPSSANEKVNMSGGHGTDVLGLPQYHTVLAFRTFGFKPNQIKIVPGLVSVMDVKPTLLHFLNLPVGRSSGNSLQDYILGDKNVVNIKQDFFTESDFSPEAVRTVHPEERKVLFEGIDYFRIDPKSTRIVVRDNMMQMILSSKQYADYYDGWVLALYPENNKVMTPVLVNLKTGYWTNDLKSELAENSPAHHMLKAMKVFFGNDITFVKNSTVSI